MNHAISSWPPSPRARGYRHGGAAPVRRGGAPGGSPGRHRAEARAIAGGRTADLVHPHGDGRRRNGRARRETPEHIPAAVATFLRRHNLPLVIRRGDDPLLANVPWDRAGTLSMRLGASDGSDIAALSHAFAGVAETGTLVLTSGADNPTTLNFLPDVHVVVVGTADIAADFETVMGRLRERFGTGALPRAVNMITGPSRSADIEQTLILGAHGPRKLHVIVFGGPDDKP